MSKPRALDLFCGAGGAAMGLHRAGFDVVGVDIRKQPRYPFAFVQADALAPPFDLASFDFIWASPPCQAYSLSSHSQRQAGRVYPDLVEPTRQLLATAPCPTVIENVPGAPIRPDLKLDGTMFADLKVVRERWFECEKFFTLRPGTDRWPGICIRGGFYSVTGHDGSSRLRKSGGPRNTVAAWRDAMGIDWMIRDELTQAIPPAYAEFVGRAAIAYAAPREAAHG